MRSLKKVLISSILSLSLLVPHTVMADEDGPSIMKTIDWAVRICHDQSYGYSQEHRWGDGGYDCSSFVISAFWAGGFHLGYSDKYQGCTADIKRAFMEAGFEWIPAEDLYLDKGTIDYLEPGDVLLIDGYHAELYIGDGLTAAAHEDVPSEDHPNRSKDPGDQGDEVCVYEYVYHPWSGVLRYKSKSSSSSGSSSSSSSSSSSESAGSDAGGLLPALFEVLPEALFVREGPSTESDAVEYLKGGDQVAVTGLTGVWGHVSIGGVKGYVNMMYMSRVRKLSSDEAAAYSYQSNVPDRIMDEVSSSTGSVPNYYEGQVLTVNTETLYVRREPGSKDDPVYALNQSDRVELIEQVGDWGKIYVSGITGWVNLHYCKA